MNHGRHLTELRRRVRPYKVKKKPDRAQRKRDVKAEIRRES